MFIPFENLAETSRIWIYQANRNLTTAEVEKAVDFLHSFIEQWTSHQQTLQGSFAILYNRFIILAIDENVQGASGCSIDKSTHALQTLENELNIPLFDRMNQVFWQDQTLQQIHLNQIKDALNQGIITENTVVFNNLINTKQELQTNWQIPLKKSWLKKYLPIETQQTLTIK